MANQDTSLVPRPKIWLRVTILVSLVVLAWIGPSGWFAKLVFSLAMTALFGTFPHSRLSTTHFEKQWFALFIHVNTSRTRLAEVIQIETDVEERMGMQLGVKGNVLVFLFFGFLSLLMIWLFDWLVPWFGGDYKLWLRTQSGDRVLAWQGNGESNFRQNLEALEDLTGLPVTRG